MAPYDNEIYRGPPDESATLTQDIRPATNDIYIVKPPQTTAQQDIPATKEPVAEDQQVGHRSSKAAKAIRLLASCTAAVAVVATLAQPVMEALKPLREWPYIGPSDSTAMYTSVTASENSRSCQVAFGDEAYRIESLQEDIYLQWFASDPDIQGDSYAGFHVTMESYLGNWKMLLTFRPQYTEPMYGEVEGKPILSGAGETLYAYATDRWGSAPDMQGILDSLDSYIAFHEPTADGWGKVLIGETMYSDISSEWTGFYNYPPWNTNWGVSEIHYTGDAGYSLDSLISEHTVNGIQWSFYYSMEKGIVAVWAVPAQENIAFCVYEDMLLWDLGIEDEATAMELFASSEELQAALRPGLQRAVEEMIAGGLHHYYLLEAAQ